MMTWSDKIAFHPWVGNRYSEGYPVAGGAIRVLLLGEAHYKSDPPDDRSHGVSFTFDSVTNYLAAKGTPGRRRSPARYWTRTGKVIAGPGSYDRQAFWHSVAFYNYVQCFQPVGTCPTEEAFAAARAAFVVLWPRSANLNMHVMSMLALENGHYRILDAVFMALFGV